MMEYFFTWYDIEREFEQKRSNWPSDWIDVNVYSDSIIIIKNMEEDDRDSSYLKEVFGRHYIAEEKSIAIDFSQRHLAIEFEEEDGEKTEKNCAPLFKEIYLQEKGKKENLGELPGSKILAFHSCKGGVGRTLSLIAYLRQYSEIHPDKKILVIDADIEAPGLTWMVGSAYRKISYLDMLAVMNCEQNMETMISGLEKLAKLSTISVETNEKSVEQYFIPVYRDRNQVFDVFSKPEQILLTKQNKFYITEMISRLGKALSVDKVLVDLRAGITEYSAPFLFDPRVEKYYVTSTSLQSVKGMNQILEQVYTKTTSDLLNSRILLTKIPNTMKEDMIYKIEDEIIANLEENFDTENATFLREDYFLEFKFDEAFIHIDDLSSLCRLLKGKELTKIINDQIQSESDSKRNIEPKMKENDVRSILKRIHDIARTETTAEGTAGVNMLVTSSIKELSRNFENELPRIVVAGAKGSGKTYIYKQLLQSKTWEKFVQLTGNKDKKDVEENTLIIPLLSTADDTNMSSMMAQCIERMNQELDLEVSAKKVVSEIRKKMEELLENPDSVVRSEWDWEWIQAMLKITGNRFDSLEDLDSYLQEKHKKVVFIVDGLEDLCIDAQLKGLDNWKFVLRSLCRSIISELNRLDKGNLGIIVFARSDMINEAIDTNTEQFRSLYQNYELNWSQTEALRLALWIAGRAYPKLTEKIDVLNATKNVLAERLTALWGIKLGKPNSKEAYSDRWILAALSDFNGQLQARDIVRFLQYSTETYGDTKLAYHDRLIMPIDVRNAIRSCSEKKIQEIKTEMRNIYQILEKFMHMTGAKTLPLTLDKIALTADEIAKLETQGFLKISDKKYYLPEIIRLALGFTYEKGARPKVLSLLVQ